MKATTFSKQQRDDDQFGADGLNRDGGAPSETVPGMEKKRKGSNTNRRLSSDSSSSSFSNKVNLANTPRALRADTFRFDDNNSKLNAEYDVIGNRLNAKYNRKETNFRGLVANDDNKESKDVDYPVGLITSTLIRSSLCPGADNQNPLLASLPLISKTAAGKNTSDSIALEAVAQQFNLSLDDPVIEFMAKEPGKGKNLRVPRIFASTGKKTPKGNAENETAAAMITDTSQNNEEENSKRSENATNESAQQVASVSSSSVSSPSSRIVVDSAVILTNPKVLIGACSDKFIRFWDLSLLSPHSGLLSSNVAAAIAASGISNTGITNITAGHVLCSCKYFKDIEGLSPSKEKGGKNGYALSGRGMFVVEEHLKILRLSNDENLLIGKNAISFPLSLA